MVKFLAKKFGEDVKKWRGEDSLRTFADKTGVSYPTLSRVENGNYPDVTTLGILCAYKGVSINDYFTGTVTYTISEVAVIVKNCITGEIVPNG